MTWRHHTRVSESVAIEINADPRGEVYRVRDIRTGEHCTEPMELAKARAQAEALRAALGEERR